MAPELDRAFGGTAPEPKPNPLTQRFEVLFEQLEAEQLDRRQVAARVYDIVETHWSFDPPLAPKVGAPAFELYVEHIKENNLSPSDYAWKLYRGIDLFRAASTKSPAFAEAKDILDTMVLKTKFTISDDIMGNKLFFIAARLGQALGNAANEEVTGKYFRAVPGDIVSFQKPGQEAVVVEDIASYTPKEVFEKLKSFQIMASILPSSPAPAPAASTPTSAPAPARN